MINLWDNESGSEPRALVEMLDSLRLAAGCREGATLLVVDQAEELLAPGAEGFLRLLRGALEQGPRVMAVATLRSDFLGTFQGHPLLEGLAYATRTVDPLPRDRLPLIIEGPAEVAGLELGLGLVSALVEDAATPDALPLLAFTLHELHARGALDLASYRASGGLEGSVRRAADGVVQDLDPDQLRQLRDVLTASLVRIDEDGQIARRRAFRDELPGGVAPLLQRLVDARLLVADRDPAGRETLEVAHEALLRTWPRLRAWLDEDRERLRLRDALRRAAARWDEHGRGADWLDHRGGRLEAVEALVALPRFAATAGTEQAYLDACRERERQERERAEAEALAERRRLEAEAEAAGVREAAARRIAARTRIAAAITLVLAIAASGAGLVAWRSAEEAIAQRQAAEAALAARDLATSRRLALSAERATEAGDAELGVRIALAALPRAVADGGPPDTGEAAAALARAVLHRHETRALTGHQGPIRSAGFLQDGTAALTAGLDGTARVWSLDGKDPLVLRGHAGPVWAAAFGPDGRIATASADGTARVWDAAGSEQAALAGHDDEVLAVALSSDLALTASVDGTARLWPLAGGEPLVLAHGGPVWWAGLDGDRALTASEDGTAGLWDTRSGERVARLDHGAPVLVGAFGPDGQFATAAEDGGARVWDRDGRELARINGRGWPTALAFAPDGTRVAVATEAMVRVHEADSRRLVTEQGQDDVVWALAFSPDGALLATASQDSTARVLDAATGATLLVLGDAGGPLRAVAFAPDGRLLTAGDDTIARVYRLDRFERFEDLLAFAITLDLAPLDAAERALLFVADR